MEAQTLNYTQDMPEVPVLPGEPIHIRSTISVPGGHGDAPITFHTVPFQNDDFPGQWFHGFRLDVDVHLLHQYVHSELLAATRERAAAISKKLRIAQYDFAQAHIDIKSQIPSTPDASLAHPDPPSTDEALHHIDKSLDADKATPHAVVPRLASQSDDRLLQIQSLADKGKLLVSDTTEDETADPRERADTPCCLPPDDIPPSLPPICTERNTPDLCERSETPGRSSAKSTPPDAIATAADGATLPSYVSTNAHHAGSNEAGVAFPPTDRPQARSPACTHPSTSPPSVQCSTKPTPYASQTKSLLPAPSSLPPTSSSDLPPLDTQDAQATTSRKRKRKDRSVVDLERQQDASSVNIAVKISSAIRLGSRKYKPSIFETWERDLWLLNPDRATLTLAGLLTQQRTYTEALLCQGIVARIIHSWCLITHEFRLSTADQSKSTRRDQKDIRLSLRCRKLGVLFLEIINKLSTHPGMSIDAYKVCPAIAAVVSVDEPFPVPSSYRDLSIGRLKVIACLVVQDLVTHPDRCWTEINREHALDPAAQIATSDFLYDDTRRALGLQATPLCPAAKTTNLSTCARAQTPCEQPEDKSRDKAGPSADVAAMLAEAVNDDDLPDTIDASKGTLLAVTEQGTLFGDNMETGAWEWSSFLNLSPVNDYPPPDNES